jgi:hypothetical protein
MTPPTVLAYAPRAPRDEPSVVPPVAPSGMPLVGSAEVVRAGGTHATVRFGGREVEARLALAFLYQPVPGDQVVVVGGEEHFIVGVLAGRGTVRLAAPADLELSAQGEVRIAGAKGVRLRGPRLTVAVEKMEVVAQIVVERTTRALRWARDLVETRAGRSRTIVEGACTTRAGDIVGTARGIVKFDGDKIHLG